MLGNSAKKFGLGKKLKEISWLALRSPAARAVIFHEWGHLVNRITISRPAPPIGGGR